jgi:glycerol uptake facilitator protein
MGFRSSQEFVAELLGTMVVIMFGCGVVAIGMSFGGMHGYAINPARDFGPRLFSVVAGFKHNGLIGSSIWIVPIVAPLFGGVLGALIYDFAIGRALDRERVKEADRRDMQRSKL